MSALPAVLVTRPEREAEPWVQALQAEGVKAEPFPLIEISALSDATALQTAWDRVPSCLAVMFVSANAVRFFMAAQAAGTSVQVCRAWATGPGTQAALVAAGWPVDQIDVPAADALQFDSEALWDVVAESALAAQALGQDEVLIVRGADSQGQMAGRDWLAQKLQQSGLKVMQTVAYARRAPVLSAAQQERAKQAMHDGSLWLFSSSEAALHLQQACPRLDLSQARALATHPRIAERLLQAGWGQVHLVPASPSAQAVSIKSLS
jgi:uroporphyrinogen-III synthase